MAIKRPIICWPTIDWQYLFHRPQQLMLGLARAGFPVHFRNPGQHPGVPPQEVFPGLWVYSDYDKLPAEVAAQAIYIVYYPPYAAWLDGSPGQFIVYDCIDDDPDFEAHEGQMLQKAHLIICVSTALIKKFQGRHSRQLLLTNGVDLSHYQPRPENPPVELMPYQAIRKPIIGFSGAFYRGWVDMELVYTIARRRPNWQLVVIGQSYGWDFGGAPANLSYLGSRTYERLPAYVRWFDVGLIPFVDNRIARGADPVKLYEYLAAGIPVVSRRLPFVADLEPPLVYQYTIPEECFVRIEQALANNRFNRGAAIQARLAFAARHTWQSKVDQLIQELSRLTWIEK